MTSRPAPNRTTAAFGWRSNGDAALTLDAREDLFLHEADDRVVIQEEVPAGALAALLQAVDDVALA